jgi:hypothetical protein
LVSWNGLTEILLSVESKGPDAIDKKRSEKVGTLWRIGSVLVGFFRNTAKVAMNQSDHQRWRDLLVTGLLRSMIAAFALLPFF